MANKMTSDQMSQMCESAKTLGFRPERLMLLDRMLSEWVKNEMTPSIAVKVLRHGQTAFEGAYGVLGPDKEPDSLTVDTIYPLCSITKPVVGALLSIMQEEGLIDLNHPVRKYIPELTGDSDSLIRIWHLLTHTSGILDEDLNKHFNEYVTNILELPLPKDEDPEEAWDEINLKIREKMRLPYMELGQAMRHNTFMAVCLAAPPTHKPQKVMSYCNTGFQLAMDIITKVTGRRIDDYATEKLFGPLKMDDSYFIFPREKLSRFVTRGEGYDGYDWLNDGILNSESGSGGLKSTVHDMAQFGQMFLNHGMLNGARVLSSASIREILTDHNAKVSAAEYNGETFDSTWGLGWNIKGSKKDDSGMLRSARSFEHGGFGGAKFLCDPDADIVAVYFAVSKTDSYSNAALFNNMVIGAIDEA